MAALIMRTEGRRGDSDRLWARFVGKVETQQYESDGSNDQEHHTESCNTVGPHEKTPLQIIKADQREGYDRSPASPCVGPGLGVRQSPNHGNLHRQLEVATGAGN